jgi:hypothetical protein
MSTPKSLESLRNSISSLFCFSPEDAKEILLTYNENGDKLVIENDEDLKAFLNSKINTIDLDISQTSQIYQKNLETIKKENEKDKLDLENFIKRKEELEKKKETEFTKEKEEVNKLTEKIRELNKQRHEIRKIIMEGIRKINLEKREVEKNIIELQKKLGLPISKPEKNPRIKHIHRPPFDRVLPLPIKITKPMFFRGPKGIRRPFGVKFGNIDFINIPKTTKDNEDIKNKTFDDWGKCFLNKTQEFTKELANKFKDIPFFNQFVT